MQNLLKKYLNHRSVFVRVGTAVAVFYLLSFFVSTMEGMEDSDKVIYFHSDSCGHCKKFTPEWTKFANNTKVNHKMVEAKEIDGAGYGGLGVEAFPTVLLVGANKQKKAEFSGERTKAGLDAWVKTL